MELRDYLAIVRKRWLSIVLITVLATAAAVAATLTATPTYTARSQVYVSVRTGGSTADLLQGSNFAARQVKSYTDIVTTPRVLLPVIDHLDLATTPDELATSVSASSPLDTSLINIQVTDADPQAASDISNAIADSLARQVAELEEPEDGPSPVQISTVRTASAPTEPSAPNGRLNVALGLLLGLALGFGLAVLREVLDTRVRTADDVRALTDASVMTTIAHDDDAVQHPLIVHTNPHSARAEAFRRLRTNLQFLDVADRLETIVVTSSLPGEGKSTVAINLAITLADAGSRVALVDADLRRPSVAEYMGLEGGVGLTTVLIGQATIDDVIQPWGSGAVHVLPAGQVPPNPSEMIGSRAMAWVLGELTKTYDVVIIDTPPLLPVTDAAILARIAGGALLVSGANRLHRNELSEALGSLEAVGARVLGVVVNHLARKQSESYAYYGPDATQPVARRRSTRPQSAAARRKPGERMNSGARTAARSVPHHQSVPRREPALADAPLAENPRPDAAQYASAQYEPRYEPQQGTPRPADAAREQDATFDDLLGGRGPAEPHPPQRWPGGHIG